MANNLDTQTVAHAWRAVVRIEYRDVFQGCEHLGPNRPDANDGVAQPGFVGRRYRPGGIVLIGKNPANGGDGTSPGDLRQYEAISALAAAQDDTATVAAFDRLMAALMQNDAMPSWKIVQVVVTPLLEKLGIALDDIAYLNAVKFRTNGSPPKKLFDRTWPQMKSQLAALQPSAAIYIGKAAFEWLTPVYRNPTPDLPPIPRMIGDTKLTKQGAAAITEIARILSGKMQ